MRRGSQTERYFSMLCGSIDVSLSTGRLIVDLEPETHDGIREWRDLSRVIRAGLITTSWPHSAVGELTPKGLALALVLCLRRRYRLLPRNEVCLVVFDIPVKKRKIRDHVRKLLKELKFIQVQQSVFVSRQDAAAHLKYYCSLLGFDDWIQVYIAKKVPTPLQRQVTL